MNIFTLFFLTLIIAVTAALTFFNLDPVTVTVWAGYTYEMPKINLILIPFGVGALTVFVFYLIRDAHRYIDGWKEARLKKKEARIQDLYSKGANAMLAGQYKDAQDFFRKLIEEQPDHPYALMRLGNLAREARNIQEAMDYLKRAREASPRNIEILFSQTEAFLDANRLEEALGALDKILRIDENNLAALIKKRSIYERLDRWEEVNEIQKRIVKSQHDPKSQEREEANLLGYRYELGRSQLEAGQFDKAEKSFRTVLKLDKTFVPAYLGEAETKLRQENTDAAIAILEEGYATTKSLTLLFRLEDLFLNLGDPNRMISLYQKAISQTPRDPRLQFFLAKLFYRLEMMDDAFDILSRLDTGEDPYPDRHKLLGNIYMRRGKPELAAEEFKKAVRLRGRLAIPYCCSSCHHQNSSWSGRCPFCGAWNTFTVDLAHTQCLM